MIVTLLIFYVIIGATVFAGTMGYFRNKYPLSACSYYRSDLFFAAIMALVPPFWLVAAFETGGFKYGFAILPPPPQK